MKNYTILLMAVTLMALGCSNESSDYAAEKAATETEKMASFDKLAASGKFAKAEISVPTIQCGSCVANVKAGIEEVEGVQDFKVDKDAKMAYVLYDESMTDVLSIEKSIALEGYDANDTRRDMDAYNALDKCCKVPEDGGGH